MKEGMGETNKPGGVTGFSGSLGTALGAASFLGAIASYYYDCVLHHHCPHLPSGSCEMDKR